MTRIGCENIDNSHAFHQQYEVSACQHVCTLYYYVRGDHTRRGGPFDGKETNISFVYNVVSPIVYCVYMRVKAPTKEAIKRTYAKGVPLLASLSRKKYDILFII